MIQGSTLREINHAQSAATLASAPNHIASENKGIWSEEMTKKRIRPPAGPKIKYCVGNRGNFGVKVFYGPCMYDGRTITWTRWFVDEADRQAAMKWFLTKDKFSVKPISKKRFLLEEINLPQFSRERLEQGEA